MTESCIAFRTAHQVRGGRAACHHLYPHSYQVAVRATGPACAEIERVLSWISRYLDGSLMLWAEDGAGIRAAQAPGMPPLYLLPQPPTAESIARHLRDDICPVLLWSFGLKVTSVVVEETEQSRLATCLHRAFGCASDE